MKYEEIIKLLDAGYTRDDILKMEEHPDQKDAADEQKAAEPKPVSEITEDIMKEVKDMFTEMKKELTAMNILNSRQPAEEKKTGEDIIASIINPAQKQKKNGGN